MVKLHLQLQINMKLNGTYKNFKKNCLSIVIECDWLVLLIWIHFSSTFSSKMPNTHIE
jgi:hypothetical protein